ESANNLKLCQVLLARVLCFALGTGSPPQRDPRDYTTFVISARSTALWRRLHSMQGRLQILIILIHGLLRQHTGTVSRPITIWSRTSLSVA
ncbi:unnamed protein product, partial [Mycena citricolor]